MGDCGAARQVPGQIERGARGIVTARRRVRPESSSSIRSRRTMMPGGGWLNGPTISIGVKSSIHLAPCSAAAARPAMIARRPDHSHAAWMLSRSDLRRILRQVHVPMDLPVVPTQLAARQDAACYRFASDKDARHAPMML